MRENSLLIICVTIVLCVVLVAGTFVFISFNNNNNQITSNTAQASVDVNNSNSQDNAQGSSSASTSSDQSGVSIISATFYSDGNPNTGEVATINLGSSNAGKTVKVSTTYYRDGHQFNDGNYATVTIGSDGNVKITDTTAMNKYPDKCVISVICDGSTISKTASLGTYKGTQTVSF